jgi:hypothetical protein
MQRSCACWAPVRPERQPAPKARPCADGWGPSKTTVAEVLLSLVYPLVWAGAFVPVLPIAMLPMLDMPSFGLFGVPAAYRHLQPPPTYVRTCACA